MFPSLSTVRDSAQYNHRIQDMILTDRKSMHRIRRLTIRYTKKCANNVPGRNTIIQVQNYYMHTYNEGARNQVL